MKELSIEEKARRYDGAIKRLEDIETGKCQKTFMFTEGLFDYIFPELAESEDERIRKALIKFFTLSDDNADYQCCGVHYKDIVAWLEKQGEQISVDKVEPKFKVGVWCIDDEDGTIFQIVKVLDNTYTYKTNEGKEYSCTHYSLENDARLWTIQDAKDGDVLATLNQILIFEKILPNNEGVSHCHYDFGCSTPQFNFNKDDNWYFGKEAKVYPATKEQRDLLFQKMKESGYEWDAEKKELKKIEQKPIELVKGEDYGIDGLYAAIDILQNTLGKVDGYQTDDGILEHECAISAVKKLYEKEPAVWSEEDARLLDNCISLIEDIPCTEEEQNWLKGIKDRVQPQNLAVTDEELAQAKKDAYNDALDKIEYHSGEPTFDDGWSAAIGYIQKKSLRHRSQWKPSDEQIKALGDINLTGNISYAGQGQELVNLYNDLKKFREEQS